MGFRNGKGKTIPENRQAFPPGNSTRPCVVQHGLWFPTLAWCGPGPGWPAEGVQEGIQLSVGEMGPFTWPTPSGPGLHPPILTPSSGLTHTCSVTVDGRARTKNQSGVIREGTQEDKTFLVQIQQLWHSRSLVSQVLSFIGVLTMCISLCPSLSSTHSAFSGPLALGMLVSVTISSAFCGTWEKLSRVECFPAGGPLGASAMLMSHTLGSDALAGPSCVLFRCGCGWSPRQCDYQRV